METAVKLHQGALEMKKILFNFSIVSFLTLSSGIKAASPCEGYIAVDGYERGMGRAIYLGELTEGGEKSKLTLNFIEGTSITESVEYECSMVKRRCYPVTEGASKFFPLCLSIAKMVAEGVTGFYFTAFPDSRCEKLNSIVFGKILCR